MAEQQQAMSVPKAPFLRGEWRDNVWVKRGAILAVALVALLYPILDTNNARIDTANLAEVYILLALGLNIVVGFAGLLDLGYAAFFAIGSYTAALFASTHFSIGNHTFSNLLFSIGPNGIHLNFFLADSVSGLHCRILRTDIWSPHPSSTRRLPGDRHPGFRRDCPQCRRKPGCQQWNLCGEEQYRGRSEPHQRSEQYCRDRRPAKLQSSRITLELSGK